jgi:hypothetical protein
MLLAIAALFLQIAPAARALPDVAFGSTVPVVKAAPAGAKPDQPKPAAGSSADKDSTGSAPATLEAASLKTVSQNSQALSTIRVPDPAPAKPVHVILPETYPRRTWILLSIAEHSAATFDAYYTRVAVSNGAREADPMMRPFANSPAIYAAIQVGPAILDFAAHRMQRSQNSFLRRTWWVPQTASTGVYLFSGIHNMSVANHP